MVGRNANQLRWFLTDTSFLVGKNIGLTHEEYERWKTPGFRVLEVGTGTSASTLKELLLAGVDVIGIEPGLLLRPDIYTQAYILLGIIQF